MNSLLQTFLKSMVSTAGAILARKMIDDVNKPKPSTSSSSVKLVNDNKTLYLDVIDSKPKPSTSIFDGFFKFLK